MIRDYQKISSTAIFCARMRAKHNIPFAKEIVKILDTKYSKWIKDLPDYGNTLNSKSDFISFIEGRYYSLNEVLKNLRDIVVVEIAVGLSPRGLEFINRKDFIYIETDLLPLIKIKKRIIKNIIKIKKLKARNNLSFLDLNPLNKNEIKKLGKRYLQISNGKKLVILHEGLLMYFNKKEKKKIYE